MNSFLDLCLALVKLCTLAVLCEKATQGFNAVRSMDMYCEKATQGFNPWIDGGYQEQFVEDHQSPTI